MNSGLAGRRGVRLRRFGLEQQGEGLLQLVRLDRCSLSWKGSARLARSASRLKRSVLPPILAVCDPTDIGTTPIDSIRTG